MTAITRDHGDLTTLHAHRVSFKELMFLYLATRLLYMVLVRWLVSTG